MRAAPRSADCGSCVRTARLAGNSVGTCGTSSATTELNRLPVSGMICGLQREISAAPSAIAKVGSRSATSVTRGFGVRDGVTDVTIGGSSSSLALRARCLEDFCSRCARSRWASPRSHAAQVGTLRGSESRWTTPCMKSPYPPRLAVPHRGEQNGCRGDVDGTCVQGLRSVTGCR